MISTKKIFILIAFLVCQRIACLAATVYPPSASTPTPVSFMENGCLQRIEPVMLDKLSQEQELLIHTGATDLRMTADNDFQNTYRVFVEKLGRARVLNFFAYRRFENNTCFYTAVTTANARDDLSFGLKLETTIVKKTPTPVIINRSGSIPAAALTTDGCFKTLFPVQIKQLKDNNKMTINSQANPGDTWDLVAPEDYETFYNSFNEKVAHGDIKNFVGFKKFENNKCVYKSMTPTNADANLDLSINLVRGARM